MTETILDFTASYRSTTNLIKWALTECETSVPTSSAVEIYLNYEASESVRMWLVPARNFLPDHLLSSWVGGNLLTVLGLWGKLRGSPEMWSKSVNTGLERRIYSLITITEYHLLARGLTGWFCWWSQRHIVLPSLAQVSVVLTTLYIVQLYNQPVTDKETGRRGITLELSSSVLVLITNTYSTLW